MPTMPPSHVIAIAGPVGSGKSTLTRGLARAFNAAGNAAPTQVNNAVRLHFDDYEVASARTPAQLEAWMQSGGDFAAFASPALLADLVSLKHGQPVQHPKTGAVMQPAPYLVLEMPLGRTHPATSELIDMLIWIDLPLDMALARNLRGMSHVAQSRPPAEAHRFVTWLDQYLDNYLNTVRQVFERQHAAVRPGADLVLDGSAGPAALVQQALAAVHTRFPRERS